MAGPEAVAVVSGIRIVRLQPIARPATTEDGSEGEELELQLELKLLVDVGLVGFPSAGKSTFISRFAAKPKIADYPFTKLEPHLGVDDMGDFRTFVVGDIPGLIEGAHEGAGLDVVFCVTSSARHRCCTWLMCRHSPDARPWTTITR